MIRAFLALDLPGDIRSALAVQQFLLPLPRRIEPALFHLTLVFLGEASACAPKPFPCTCRGLACLAATARVWPLPPLRPPIR